MVRGAALEGSTRAPGYEPENMGGEFAWRNIRAPLCSIQSYTPCFQVLILVHEYLGTNHMGLTREQKSSLLVVIGRWDPWRLREWYLGISIHIEDQGWVTRDRKCNRGTS